MADPKFKKILILVEGQTEERFVKDVLQPHFVSRLIHIEPKILVTKITNSGKQFKGGVSTFDKIRTDIRNLLTDSSARMITTMLDLYGVPKDTPGFSTISSNLSGRAKAVAIEGAIEQEFNDARFRAYLMVHEFEGMLYSEPAVLPQVLTQTGKTSEMQKVRGAFSSPEDINEGPDTHPSARISRLFPQYRKGLHGPTALSRIGLDRLRQECAHFADWIRLMEQV
ncbi:MAG: DUF4276 family protein [Spirochaetia bacterium]|nr:DUF4276 family protein [Spirochaetia bacterium]